MIYLLTSRDGRCLIGKLKGSKVIAQSIRAASMSARWEGKIMRQPLVLCAALGIALGATAANGAELRSFAGKVDGDNDGQVAAVENLIASGAKGILITPNDSRAIVPAIEKARAAGILVIALDTPLDPPTAADATFATDNFLAGELIGQWAVKTLGPKAPSAKIALLDLNVNQISVDVARDQGFLKGFGIDLGNPARIGDEKDA